MSFAAGASECVGGLVIRNCGGNFVGISSDNHAAIYVDFRHVYTLIFLFFFEDPDVVVDYLDVRIP